MSGTIENAKIVATSLGREDHGIFTAYISFEYDEGGQSFGGYGLDAYKAPKDCRIGTAWGMEFIMRVLETVGAESWEKLIGKHVRVDHSHASVSGIGHITKNKWFYPREDLKEFE